MGILWSLSALESGCMKVILVSKIILQKSKGEDPLLFLFNKILNLTIKYCGKIVYCSSFRKVKSHIC